ncbi:MAG: peptidoglycan-associated lipoprotein [Syntrophaceae bacterium]|nr:MAG: peptidoglycan-associated lipoprotein [Syntrophaceae bacterium]
MKKHLTLIGLLMVFVFGLTIFSGCAEKKAVVKDEAIQEQKVAPTQTAPVAVKDDEAARRAKEQADREAALKEQADREAALKAQAAKDRAARNAAALNDLNIQNIYFDYDKSSIRPDAREILKANADIFTKNSAAKIVVEGHCDERGTAEYNMALGERRAQETKQYLVNLGINVSRLETISYGEERPANEAHDEAAWAQNRRAQFLLK